MKKIMVINAGWEQEPLIREAKNMGLFVLAVDLHEKAHSFPFADQCEIADPRDMLRCCEIADNNGIDAVIADQCDYSIFTSAYIAEQLGLPGPRLKYAQIANKRWMRSICQKSGIIQPKFEVVLNLDGAKTAAKKIGFPVVVKPVDNRGAFGVRIAGAPSDLASTYFEALANSHSREVLIEKKIEGLHITIDGFAFGKNKHMSLAVASKDIFDGSRPIVLNVYYPAMIGAEAISRLKKINDKIMHSVGIEYGATHVEYILGNDNRPYLLEIAARGGGVHTASKIIPAITGVNISRLLIKWALGEKMEIPKTFEGKWKAAYLGFIVFKPGRIKQITGVEELRTKINGLLHFQLLVKEGDCIGEVKSGANRHGFYIIADNDIPLAIEKSKLLKSAVRAEYFNA